MNCWNCGYPIETGSKVCRRCESDQTEHEDIDPEALQDAAAKLESIAPGTLESLGKLASKHDTTEDLVNAVFVGQCPQCNSSKVGDCDPDYSNPFLGRCFNCGNVWCTECGYMLKKGEKQCPGEEEHFADLPEPPDFLA